MLLVDPILEYLELPLGAVTFHFPHDNHSNTSIDYNLKMAFDHLSIHVCSNITTIKCYFALN